MNDFEKALIEFCSQKPRFSLKEAEAVLSEIKTHKQSIPDFLEYCPLTFRDLQGKKNDKFFSRHHFFNGFKFRVVLSEFEVANSILIPGHRFIPFYFSDLASFSLRDIETKALIPLKKIPFKLKELYEYYFAFNSETIKESIISDDKTNTKIVGRDPDGFVKVKAFDLKNLQTSSNIKNFNSIILQVTNWTKGEFILEPCKEDLHFDQEQAYLFAEELENSLYKVFEYFGPYIDIPEQLAWAFFFSGDKILNNPVISIEEALHISEHIDYKYVDDNTILWFKNDNASSWGKHHRAKDDNLFSISSGKISSIDSIFDEIGIPISSKELILFMNASEKQDISFSNFIGNTLPVNIPFKDKAQEIALLNHIEELFESSKTNILPANNSNELKFIYDNINRLRKFFTLYSIENLTTNNTSKELIYREIRDQINSLSSILSFYINNPLNLNQINKLSDLADYIEEHFTIIEGFFDK